MSYKTVCYIQFNNNCERALLGTVVVRCAVAPPSPEMDFRIRPRAGRYSEIATCEFAKTIVFVTCLACFFACVLPCGPIFRNRFRGGCLHTMAVDEMNGGRAPPSTRMHYSSCFLFVLVSHKFGFRAANPRSSQATTSAMEGGGGMYLVLAWCEKMHPREEQLYPPPKT